MRPAPTPAMVGFSSARMSSCELSVPRFLHDYWRKQVLAKGFGSIPLELRLLRADWRFQCISGTSISKKRGGDVAACRICQCPISAFLKYIRNLQEISVVIEGVIIRLPRWLAWYGRVSILLLAVFVLAGCLRKHDEGYFLKTGKEFREKKDYPRALLQFKNAAQVKPTDPEPYYQAGLTHLRTGDYRSAVAAYKKAVGLNPKHAGAQLGLAQLMAASRDKGVATEAQERAKAVVKDAPDNDAALNILALTELNLGQTKDAQKHLEEAFQKFPQNLKVAANLASMKLSQRDFKGAEEILTKAAAEAPKSAKPPVALGRLYAMRHNFPEAERQFLHALEIDPKYAVALLDLADLQMLEGAIDRAEQTYKRIAALPEGEYKHAHAVFLFRQGRNETAIAEFEKLFQQDHHARATRTRLVEAYLRTGKLANAVTLLTAVLKENGKDQDALLQRAEISIIGKNFKQAEEDLDSVLHLQPDSAEAHYLLSAAHDARGAQRSRKEELAKALELHPAMLQARLELAQCYIASGNFRNAMDLLEQAPPAQQQTLGAIVQRNWALAGLQNWADLRKSIDQGLALARTPDLLLQDGMFRMQQKDYAGARSSLEEGLKKAKDPRLLKALAGTYMAQNQRSAALRAIEEQVAQAPKSAELKCFLGQWLLATGSPQRAKAAFLAARELAPKFIDADLGLAQTDVATGNLNAATQRLTGLLGSAGENPKIRLMLGTIEESANSPDRAVEQYRKALQSDPENIMALNNLAFLLVDQGELNEALGLAQKAMELAPGEASVEDTLGWALFHKGMYKEAVQHFKNAFSKQSVPRIQYHLAMAYVMVGDDDLGQQAYLSALKTSPNAPEARLAGQIVARGRTRF
jgi:cellulose synthase operon protein C